MIKSEDYMHLWIDDNILHIVYNPNTVIDLKVAENIVKNRLRFQNGTYYPILCDLRQLKIVTKPARDYLAQQGSTMAIAVALIIKETYSGKISSVFLKTSHPNVPTKEFKNEREALQFLNSFIE